MREYSPPQLTKVELRVDEAVLINCKTAQCIIPDAQQYCTDCGCGATSAGGTSIGCSIAGS